MNKLEKILEISKLRGYENLNQECRSKLTLSLCSKCSVYKVLGRGYCSFPEIANELLEEYKDSELNKEEIEKIKLNKRERGLCIYTQSGWISRDKCGNLYYYETKPFKVDDSWTSDNYNFVRIAKELFQFIKWEDNEPYSVEEMLKWEVDK